MIPSLRLSLSLILGCFGLTGTAAAQTNLLLNGDFTSGYGAYIGLAAVVDHWSYYNDPIEGTNHYAIFQGGEIRLNEGGGASDGLQQSFTATQGLTYTASIDAKLAHGFEPLSLQIEVRGSDGTSIVDSLLNSVTSENFITFDFDFVASETSLWFVIRDLTPSVEPDNNFTDIVVTNARVSLSLAAVPEPSTYALCAGLGALALAIRRRRR